MPHQADIILLSDRRRGRTLLEKVRERGYGPVYTQSQPNTCPGCGRRAWYVGRFSAECANAKCATALPIGGDGQGQ